MRPFSSVSLLWKILGSTSVAITILFAGLEWIVQEEFVRITSRSLDEEVAASFHAYDSLWRARAEQLASLSLVLSRMPDVRAAFNTGDPATIRDTAGEVWDKIAARGALFLVSDPHGTVVAALGRGAAGVRELPLVRTAAERFPKQSSGFVVHQGGLFQIVVTPVYVAAGAGQALITVLVAGVPVDAALANELKQATGGSDFLFFAGGREIASSLPAGVSTPPGNKFGQFTRPLLDIGGRPVGELRILRSFAAAQNRIAALRRNLLWVWAATVIAGLLLTFLLARQLVRPIKALDAAAVRIAAGDYDVHLPVRNDDEIGRLTRTFNSMCAAIQSAREELIRRERIATIARLGTSIVHDLRNPLASIYGGAEMLVDDELSPSQVKRLAANIYAASRRVQELLQELVDATKGRAHGREACLLSEVIRAAYEPLAQTAAQRKVEMRFDVPADVELSLARSPMERVFQNLLANAMEAMPGGGCVEVTARHNGSEVVVSVQDSGPGVPAPVAAQLFQPFVSAGKKNGMGLGLALSRETVREHGGDLWLDRARGRGACFCMRLPVDSHAA